MDEATTAKARRPLEIVIWIGLLATIIAVMGGFLWAKLRMRSSPLQKPLVVVGQVSGFSLTNQFGEPVTLTNLLGRVWIADVIFTRCMSSCEILTRRLGTLQSKLPPPDQVQIVSLTADPEFDTPVVLRRYADNHDVPPGRWQFLTGPKKEIYRLAIEDLKFVVVDRSKEEREPYEEMFLHSTRFVLVDQQGRIRGYFNGTEPDAEDQLLAAVDHLLRED